MSAEDGIVTDKKTRQKSSSWLDEETQEEEKGPRNRQKNQTPHSQLLLLRILEKL